MNRKNFKYGFSIVQVLVAAAMIGLLAVALMRLGDFTNKNTQKQQESVALSSIQNRITAIGRDLPSWVQNLRSRPSTQDWASKCFPLNPASDYNWSTCPESSIPTASDAGLSDFSDASSLPYRYTVALVDAAGDPIAGPQAAPLLYDANGAPCSDAPRCRFRATGFAMTQKRLNDASGGPGVARFVVKLERVAANAQDATPFKPRYFTIDLGQNWTEIVGGCPSPLVMTGFDESRAPVCKRIEIEFETISGRRSRRGASDYWDYQNFKAAAGADSFPGPGEWLGSARRPKLALPYALSKRDVPRIENRNSGGELVNKHLAPHFPFRNDGAKRGNFDDLDQIYRGPKYGAWSMKQPGHWDNPGQWKSNSEAEDEAGSYEDLAPAMKQLWEDIVKRRPPPRTCTMGLPGQFDCSQKYQSPSDRGRGSLLSNLISAGDTNWDRRDPNRLVDYNDGASSTTHGRYGAICPRGYIVVSCIRSSMGKASLNEPVEYDAGYVFTGPLTALDGKSLAIGCQTNDFTQLAESGVALQVNCMRAEAKLR